MHTKALYAGSFDPFTNGHKQIVEDALGVFETVVVLIATNSAKRRRMDCVLTQEAIRQTFANNSRVQVEFYGGFVADYCSEHNINHLIRGLRNITDFAYEENIAKINAEINHNIKTIYFRTANEVISSSMVWELFTNKKDVSAYLPPPVFAMLNSSKRAQL